MVELVYTSALKADARKGLRVQVSLSAIGDKSVQNNWTWLPLGYILMLMRRWTWGCERHCNWKGTYRARNDRRMVRHALIDEEDVVLTNVIAEAKSDILAWNRYW